MEAKLVTACIFLPWVMLTDGRPCTSNQREYLYVRYGQCQELQCCDRDHAELLDTFWYKYDEESQSWELIAPDTSDILFLELNATLATNHAQFSDTGRYKYTRPSGKSIQSDESGTEFDLKVVACDQLARGPFPIAPLPCGVTSAKVGDNVTIPCTGYFGCDKDDVRMVTWFTKSKASDYSSLTDVQAADDRITQTDRQCQTKVFTSLYIVNDKET
ncbi:hypothetical protein DPMN_037243 [Dreissena polymorpha]|uniref:Ig-like domain-containing protein n=1 Tax=Dreissena polymorpha TaxID=45954 RepID=A0A9D4MEM5_DREPO|nr:hypothetical protein DPMN_037243 [Dreissena polymorpha]